MSERNPGHHASHQKESSRREFLIYGLSASLTGTGTGAALMGTIVNIIAQGEAEKEVARVKQIVQKRDELACGKSQDEERKLECLKNSREVLDVFSDYQRRLAWDANGGWMGSTLATSGVVSALIGFGLKLADTFIQRRELPTG